MNTQLMTPNKDSIVKKMFWVCILGFGGFLAWGSIAPLEEGVAASGQIVVEDDRQVIQHLEGGIVREILVREGQFVTRGETLLVLQKTASLASRDQVIQEYAALAASVQRLKALRDNLAQPNFDILNELSLDEEERLGIIRRETSLFSQQKKSLQADIAVLRARMQAAQQTQSSRTAQINISQKALLSAKDELSVISDMFSQQLARIDQVTNTERLVATLEGDIARLKSEQQDAFASELDFKAQISQVEARIAQETAASLLETNAELLVVDERLNTAQDVLDRAVIVAPVSGEVLNMAFATVGGVVRSGETIMEIVPSIGEVTASIQISPADRSSVFEGQIVRTQFSSYRGWQAPRLAGEVIDVSADLKTDPVTSALYYEARVRVPASEIERTQDINIIPGMPVDVFIFSGKSRTLLDYIMEPLGESFFRGVRTG